MSDEFDVVVIGSGFGGSVAALRLAERGYRVVVLERGRRFDDADFARTTWNVRRYLWAPLLRCFGILEISPFRDLVVLHGSGVGGGSLGYANVLMEPSAAMYEAPGWRDLDDWRTALAPHFETARRMLGVAINPRMWPADDTLGRIANELHVGDAEPLQVGVLFGEDGREGEPMPDPYFGGRGPERRACVHCGACMVGCRYNAKNTLVKNYLYLAERAGITIVPEAEVRDIRPVDDDDGDRYEIRWRRSTSLPSWRERRLRARAVVVAAGALGTMRLLFRCREITRSLPKISPRLGDDVRTNSESLLGSVARNGDVDYSRGIAITSMIAPDAATRIEPVRYPAGSGLMRLLGAPLVAAGGGIVGRLARAVAWIAMHPIDAWRSYVRPGWAERTTILLVMQTVDERIRMRLGRSVFTLWRRGLVSLRSDDAGSSATMDPASLSVGERVLRRFGELTNGIVAGSINESILRTPTTAHILGGCRIGKDATESVVSTSFELHGHPGIFVTDGSVVPANPGVNPSLTIAALAELAMTRVPDRIGPPSGAAVPHFSGVPESGTLQVRRSHPDVANSRA